MLFKCLKCDRVSTDNSCPTYGTAYIKHAQTIHWLKPTAEGEVAHQAINLNGVHTKLSLACKAFAAISLKPVKGVVRYISTPAKHAVTCPDCIAKFPTEPVVEPALLSANVEPPINSRTINEYIPDPNPQALADSLDGLQ